MHNKTCPQCKKEFQTVKKHMKFCSKRCNWDSKKLPKIIVTSKTCTKCKKNKDISQFWKQADSRDGHHTWCKSCKKHKPKITVYKCKDCGKSITRRVYTYSKIKKICPQCSINRILQKNGGRPHNYSGTNCYTGRDYATWKASAKRRNIKWAISKEELVQIYKKQDGKCALSGTKMELFSNSPYRLSIDRINSSLHYSIKNVQFVCSIINVMKNKYPENVFIEMCKNIYLYNRKNIKLSKS